MTTISVTIPTFRRPDSFLRAARSVLRQADAPGAIELVAVDNSPEASAAAAFATLQAEAGSIPVRLAHEPKPGVANARNASMALVTGDLVAFLDDDQEASPHWLAALCRVQRETGVDAVFGPVTAQLPVGSGPHQAFVEQLHTRTGPTESGPVPRYFAMCNALLVRSTMLAAAAPFALETNEKGGEDDILFSTAQAAGRRFAWAADAAVTEHIPPERAKLSYALKRSFAYGQGPCETAYSASPKQWGEIAKHMMVGAAQSVACGGAAGIAFLARAPQRYWLLDKAVRGAGKVVWWREQRFYGATLDRATRSKGAPG
jgi:glycosyltransferase involved in cell wall biosynthesis